MNQIYALFLCEIKDNVLSWNYPLAFYSSPEVAFEAREFFSKLHNNPDFVYQVFTFPVY